MSPLGEAPSGKGEEQREKQGWSEKCDPGRRGERAEERKHHRQRGKERVKKKGEGVLIGGENSKQKTERWRHRWRGEERAKK
jgi:hypothetical protein